MKKYKLTDDTIVHNGRTLYRIQALRSFDEVEVGDLGGYVESESNLSHADDCWLYGNSKAYENAKVVDDACLLNSSEAYGNSIVKCSAIMLNRSKVFDYSIVGGNAIIYDDAEIYGKSQVEGNVSNYSKIYDSWIQKESFIEGNSGIYCTNILPGTSILDDIVQKNSDYMTFIDPAFQTYITYVRKDGKWKCTGDFEENYIEEQMVKYPEYTEYYKAVINLLNSYKGNE